VRHRAPAAIALLFATTLALGWGALAAAAAPSDDPTPTAAATGSSQVSFTVGTSSPTPSPSSSPGGSTGGGSTGGSGGSGSGSGDGGGTTPPACVPTTTTPTLSGSATAGTGTLRLNTHRAAQGAQLTVTGEGFQVGEKVVLAIYSSPVKLGVFIARTNGQLVAQVTIPQRTQLGDHTIQATGFADCKVEAAAIEIVSPSGSGTSVFPWIVWAVAGGCVGLAAIGLLLALAFGWLPSLFAIGVSAGAVP
jgi:hypothetical protein